MFLLPALVIFVCLDRGFEVVVDLLEVEKCDVVSAYCQRFFSQLSPISFLRSDAFALTNSKKKATHTQRPYTALKLSPV
jgi:hypothetical protein